MLVDLIGRERWGAGGPAGHIVASAKLFMAIGAIVMGLAAASTALAGSSVRRWGPLRRSDWCFAAVFTVLVTAALCKIVLGGRFASATPFVPIVGCIGAFAAAAASMLLWPAPIEEDAVSAGSGAPQAGS